LQTQTDDHHQHYHCPLKHLSNSAVSQLHRLFGQTISLPWSAFIFSHLFVTKDEIYEELVDSYSQQPLRFCGDGRLTLMPKSHLTGKMILIQLRSPVQQLQSEVNQLRRSHSSIPSHPAPSIPPATRPSTWSDRQIIDRRATWAIEAKDRLNAWESRVSKLEARFKQGK
jgi:hypothetical protein